MGSIKANVRLDLSLTFYEVTALREQWLGILNARLPLLLDAAELQHCDTAGLQLLCATVKAARQAGLPCEVLDPSKVLLEAATHVGMPLSALGIHEEEEAQESPQLRLNPRQPPC